MKKPLIIYALGIILGIIIATLEINLLFIGILFLIIIPFAFSLDIKRFSIFLVLILFSFTRMKTIDNAYLKEYDQKYIRYLAVVEDNHHKNSQKIKIKQINGKKVNQSSLFYTEEKLEIGDVITGMAFFQLPLEKMNPTDFNQKNYLGRQNIRSTLRTKSNIEIVGKDSSLLLKIKKSLLNYLHDIPLKGQNKELILRIFTGKSKLDENLEDSVKSLGLAHIIAISGLHIGLFVLIALFFSRWIHRRILFPIVLFLIGIYAYAIGFPPSIKRALLFTSLLYFCEVFHLAHDEINILLFTLCIILLINPYELFSPGLQFSFLATFVILKNQNLREEEDIFQIVKISFLISFFLLPLQIYYFNEFHLGFLIGNLFIVPLFTFIIGFSFMSYLIFPLKVFLFKLLNPFINLLWLTLYGGNLLSKTLKIRSLTIFEIIIFYLLIFLYTKRANFYLLTKNNFELILKIYTVSTAVLLGAQLIFDPLSVKVLYMGQEDANIIEYNNTKILYDVGGNYYSSENNRLKTYLEHKGISKIDGAILSHFDLDHIGNLPSINDKIKYIMSRPAGREDLEAVTGKIGNEYLEIKNNMNLKDGPVDYLFYYNADGKSENDLSVILKLSHYNTNILFTGDVEKDTEEFLLDKNISSEILLVPHHGSNTSSTDEFIDVVNPEIAIISCGINNRFGFPHEEVLERYEKRNIPVYQTNTHGMIEVQSNRFGWKVKAKTEDYYEDLLFMLIYIYIIIYLVLLEKETNYEIS